MHRLIVICLNLALLPGAVLALAASPRADEPVVVITNPLDDGVSAAEVIARAGGTILAAGWTSHVAVAAAGDQTLPARLRQAGAIVLLDGSAAVTCGTSLEKRV